MPRVSWSGCATACSCRRGTPNAFWGALQRFRELEIEPPTAERLSRMVRSTLRAFEEDFARRLLEQLSPTTTAGRDALLETPSLESPSVPLLELRADPGPVSIDTLEGELDKLALLRELELPPRLFERLALGIVKAYRRRAVVEEVHELRRHPASVRMTLLSAFCHLRAGELIDSLGDLLIEMVHCVAHRAEVRVERESIADYKGVSGRTACRSRSPRPRWITPTNRSRRSFIRLRMSPSSAILFASSRLPAPPIVSNFTP